MMGNFGIESARADQMAGFIAGNIFTILAVAVPTQ